METQTASVKKIALNYGLLLALAIIVLSVIVYALGMSVEQPWWQSLLSFVFMIAIIWMGLKAYKLGSGGFMSLGDALKVGLAISVISGIVGSIFTYIFITFIEPDFIAQMLQTTQENMVEQNPDMTQEQLDMAMGMSEKFLSPWIMVALGIIYSLFFGFIISLIEGLILKNNRPELQ